MSTPESTPSALKPGFLWVVHQVGAEHALKAEIARNWPEFRFAYSRPGFLTYKLPEDHQLLPDLDLRCVFARAWGWCLGRAAGTTDDQRLADVWRLAAGRKYDHLHVWPRDERAVGDGGFEPIIPTECEDLGARILDARPEELKLFPLNRIAHVGQRILDVIVVGEGEWWVGWHLTAAPPSRWPGGAPLIRRPEPMISRAYLKLAEGLDWSQLPLRRGDACVEIGAAPGGASQALIDRGMYVTGVDPAEVHPLLQRHPQFQHVRARGGDMKRKFFAPFKWLFIDTNVAPKHTLDTVEAIATHREVHLRGMLITLKLLEWELAEEIPACLGRIRTWDFQYVRARQLAYNRQEVCVAVLKRRFLRRAPVLKKARRAPGSSAAGTPPEPPGETTEDQ